jgi:hypothetical protein
MSTVHRAARTCPHCQATRKSSAATKWTSHREGRRNDIVIAYFALALILFAIGAAFSAYLSATGAFKTSSSTPAKTCTAIEYKYDIC